MENIIPYGNSIPTFLLIFVRISSMFIAAPFWGRRNFPNHLKIALALLITLLIYPTFTGELVIPIHGLEFAAYGIKEMLIGLTIGYITMAVFSSLHLAGQFIDMIMGFGIVNVIDPQSNVQVPLMGNFIYILTLLIYLSINGHHMLFAATIESLTLVPPNSVFISSNLFNFFIILFSNIFYIAFKISLPVVAAVFLVDVGLGIVARTVPQMNVFIVGMPVKIFVGFMIILATLPIFTKITSNILTEIFSIIKIFFGMFKVVN